MTDQAREEASSDASEDAAQEEAEEAAQEDADDANTAEQEPPEDEPIVETAKKTPELVDLDKVVKLLDADRGKFRLEAMRAFYFVAKDDPSRVEPYTEEIIDHIRDDYRLAGSKAVHVLGRVAREHPESVLPAMEEIIEKLGQKPPRRGYRAANTLSPLLAHEPEAFVSYADELIGELTGRPDPVKRGEELQEMDPEDRKEYTELVNSRKNEVRADFIRTKGIREFAAHALVEVAKLEPDVIAERIEDLAPGMATEPAAARLGATDAVLKVAEHDPDAVEPVVDDLIERLDDPAEGVRPHAVQALGHAGATEAVEPLRELAADTDVDEDLRGLAADTADFLSDAV